MKGKKPIKPKTGGPVKKELGSAPLEIRLNKYIANAGVCSRREADQLIADGKVKVNGEVVTELGRKVLSTDKVVYGGKTLKTEKLQYILLNKPNDYITTVTDTHDRKTVMSLLKGACDERIYPVGRLDRATTGLLLFTNDGDLAKKLTHPSYKIKKIYQVTLDKPITNQDFDDILKGVKLEDGLAVPDEMAVVTDDRMVLGIEIHIGKNRIVRRIFEHKGYKVVKLDRVMFGTLTKKNLTRGKYRHLDPREVVQLKNLSGGRK
ncbi:pseudouridine synthase [Marinoscillum luteum]|uniref:Pseudouridine synthase n=1 Tax=Marinoscillum luteum TaxID=861051 RepID=A0ABW7N6H8_9BACT